MKWIKQLLCKHEYIFIGTEESRYNKYWLYRCKKCRHAEIVDVWELKNKIENPSIKLLKKTANYWRDILILPKYVALPIEDDTKYDSRIAAYFINEYRKKGIDIKAYQKARGAVSDG